MTKRISSLLSVAGVTLLIAACAPTVPSVEEGQGSSSSDSSSSYVQQLPMEDGYEDPVESSSSSAAVSAAMERTSSSKKSSAAAAVTASVAAFVSVSVPTPAPAAKVITIDVSNFAFAPTAITVKKGQKVTLRLKGSSGHHGFGIPQLGINTVVDEGKTVDIELPTDQVGTFSFRCTIPCGPGHSDMKGTITISE